jgi:hypothetical protein
MYFIRDDTGGWVLWNANEAYFFVGFSTRGLHVSWLGYPWFLFKSYLGGFAAAELPDDERSSLVVVRVTSAGAEHHILKQDSEPGSGPALYTPRGGYIYANCPALRGLCVWAGDHFDPATLDGRRGIDGIAALTGKTLENESGWSKRGLDPNFTIDVGDKFKLLVNTKETGHGAISIDMLSPGRTPTRVFNLDVRNERVNRNEYRHAFQDRE